MLLESRGLVGLRESGTGLRLGRKWFILNPAGADNDIFLF